MEALAYDCDYYYNLLRIQSSTAKQIADIRWDFLWEANVINALDYGSGCGFFKAFAPGWVEVDTYDIMPVPQTGLTRKHYDLITFWDVLEHVDWKRKPSKKIDAIIQMGDYIAITVPILPIGKDFKTWKHNKPGEHLFRFKSFDAVIHFFKQRGFEFVKADMRECVIREDIVSFLFTRTKKVI